LLLPAGSPACSIFQKQKLKTASLGNKFDLPSVIQTGMGLIVKTIRTTTLSIELNMLRA
jgi:hypothetical protein